jgi:ssDNA-binding Zn-finger/Zn-ribbon topoisomerase 1
MKNEVPKVACPYCGDQAILRDSAIVYHGRSYGLIWLCSNYPTCDAYVGVHEGTKKPFGRMSNAELREWKKRAHEVLDELWKSISDFTNPYRNV